jgi:hypothetical protein
MSKALLVAGLALSVVVGIVTYQNTPAAALPPPATPEPTPEPQLVLTTEAHRAGCLFEAGFNVCQENETRLQDFYARYRELLGAPIGAWDGQCQPFTFAKVCYRPGNPVDWRTELANGGLDHLIASGFSPQPGSTPHRAVLDWLQDQRERGVDTLRLVGRPLSPPILDRHSGLVRQWFDKATFEFPQEAHSGAQVRRLPLGELSRPLPPPPVPPAPVAPTMVTTADSPTATFPALWVAALLVLGLAVLAGRRFAAGAPRGRPL